MSTAEEFILIQLMKEQPYSSQIVNYPSVQHTGAQFSFFSLMRPRENSYEEYKKFLDTRVTTNPTELSKNMRTKFFKF